MNTPVFIDLRVRLRVGDVGFLVETKTKVGGSYWGVYERPAHRGSIPRLFGSCGQVKDAERVACGMARITEILKNDRARIAQLWKHELAAALERAGYPELLPEVDKAPSAIVLDEHEANPRDICRHCGVLRKVHLASNQRHAFEAVQGSDPCEDCGKKFSEHNVRHMFKPVGASKPQGARRHG